MPTDLEPVFRRLKAILEPYGRRLHVTEEGPTTFAVDAAPSADRDPTTWFGGMAHRRAGSAFESERA
jgi:hypothetical protein